MKVLLYFLISFTFFYSCTTSKPKLPDHLKVRDGLNNFINKADKGDSVTVVYFGGSITEAAGWRVQTAEWLRNYFENEAIIEVNASIGGTNSEFGAYRFDRDVAPHNPDLVFVEFAVNDSGSDSMQIIRAMEGIVRKIWQNNLKTDICFIYTVKADKFDSVSPPNLFKSVRAMEVIANYYGIPSINFGSEIAEMIKKGNLITEGGSAFLDTTPVFSSDGVHPHLETGHKIYTEIFTEAFQITAAYSDKNRRKLSKPLHQDNLCDAKLEKIPGNAFYGEWEEINEENNDFYQSFGDRIPGTMMTKKTGDSISFRFTGDRIGLTDVIGPKSGYLLMKIDNKAADTIKRFDSYCHFYRRNFFLIKNLENKEHKISIVLLQKPDNKRAILNSQKKIETNPELFEGHEWYVSGILLNGKFLDKEK
jgi:lysophospholipase L1-like esterase